MALEIIEATPALAFDLARVRNRAWRSAYAELAPSALPDASDDAAKARRLAQGMAAGTERCLLLRIKGRAAGMCTLRAHGDAGEVKSLYLLAEHWGTGAGGQLLRFAEDDLRRRGFRRAVLWTPRVNGRARQFYARHGYTPTGATKDIQLGGRRQALQYGKNL